MANANEVKENTGFSIGGVAPVAHIKKLEILIDKSLKDLNMFMVQQDIQIVYLKLVMRVS